MAKPLERPSTASPLAGLLDHDAALRATRSLPPHETPATPRLAPLPRQARPVSACIKRECVLTQPTDEALVRLTELIRRSTGARVSVSHAVRSLLLVLGPAWPRLEEELRALAPMRLPSNAKGSEPAREALERALAGALARAVRSSHGTP